MTTLSRAGVETLTEAVEAALAARGLCLSTAHEPSAEQRQQLADVDAAVQRALRAITKMLRSLPLRRRAVAYLLSMLSGHLQASDIRRARGKPGRG